MAVKDDNSDSVEGAAYDTPKDMKRSSIADPDSPQTDRQTNKALEGYLQINRIISYVGDHHAL
jgi:hypothetical protein